MKKCRLLTEDSAILTQETGCDILLEICETVAKLKRLVIARLTAHRLPVDGVPLHRLPIDKIPLTYEEVE